MTLASLKQQQGAALVIGLLLLLAITLLAVSSMRGTTLQEKMAANLYDRELIFQVAEAGVREAEAILATPTAVAVLLSRPGFYGAPVAANTERWLDPATNWANAAIDIQQLAGGTPQYIVEYMGYSPSPPGCDRGTRIPQNCLAETFRITARVNMQDRASVMIQTLYRR
jgi:type IV pilus assembly protein PilX